MLPRLPLEKLGCSTPSPDDDDDDYCDDDDDDDDDGDDGDYRCPMQHVQQVF